MPKPCATSSLECGKAGLSRTARGSELHPWRYERFCVGFLCDCQRYTGAAFSPLLVETSTLPGTRHAPAEMASLADSVRNSFGENEAPELKRLLASIDAWQWNSGNKSTTAHTSVVL